MKLLLVRDEIEANPKDGLWFWVVLLDFQPNISERLLALVGSWTSSSASNYSKRSSTFCYFMYVDLRLGHENIGEMVIKWLYSFDITTGSDERTTSVGANPK